MSRHTITDLELFGFADLLQLPLMRTDDGHAKCHASRTIALAIPVSTEIYFSTETYALGAVTAVTRIAGDVWLFVVSSDYGKKFGAMVFPGAEAGYSIGRKGIVFPKDSELHSSLERTKDVASKAKAVFIYANSKWKEVADVNAVVKLL